MTVRRACVLGFAGLSVSACFMDGKYVVEVSDDTVRVMDSASPLSDGGVPSADPLLGTGTGLSSTAPGASSAPSHCPAGEIDGPDKICYAALGRVASWQEAVDGCAEMGPGWGILTVRRVQEHDALKQILDVDTWLGASDAEQSDNWRWLGDLEPFYIGHSGAGAGVGAAFVQWAKDEPSATAETEQCARYVEYTQGDWYWEDTECAQELSTLCEKR